MVFSDTSLGWGEGKERERGREGMTQCKGVTQRGRAGGREGGREGGTCRCAPRASARCGGRGLELERPWPGSNLSRRK